MKAFVRSVSASVGKKCFYLDGASVNAQEANVVQVGDGFQLLLQSIQLGHLPCVEGSECRAQIAALPHYSRRTRDSAPMQASLPGLQMPQRRGDCARAPQACPSRRETARTRRLGAPRAETQRARTWPARERARGVGSQQLGCRKDCSDAEARGMRASGYGPGSHPPGEHSSWRQQ